MPSGATFLFDASDIDGNNSQNSAYADGAEIGTWKNKGSAVDGTAAGGHRPVVNRATKALSFDGTSDFFFLVGSASAAAFIANTGVFEAFLVFRPLDVGVTLYIAGNNYNGATERGIAWILKDNKIGFQIAKDAIGTFNVNYTSTFTINNAEWVVINVRGDGSTLSVTKNYGAAETAAITGLITANLAEDILLGDVAGDPTVRNMANQDIALFAIYPSVLTAAQRAQALAHIAANTAIGARATQRVAVIGDSTAAGFAADVSFSQELQNDYAAQRAVMNRGISGAAYSGISTAYTVSVAGRDHQYLVLLGGVNDILTDVTGATAFGNYNTGIITDAIAAGIYAKIVWCTPLPFGNYAGWTAGRQTQMDALLTSIRGRSGTNLVICDIEADFDDGAKKMKVIYDSGDGLHPNQAGEDRMKVLIKASLGITP